MGLKIFTECSIRVVYLPVGVDVNPNDYISDHVTPNPTPFGSPQPMDM